MITKQGMLDLTVGQRVRSMVGDGLLIVTYNAGGEILFAYDGREASYGHEFVAHHFRLDVPEQRISEGFYRHRAAGPDDVYYVKGVGIFDEDGHGNPDAPRHVFYESTRSRQLVLRPVGDGKIEGAYLGNIRSECEFGQLVTWPDGIVRPRFVRMEYAK